MNIPSKNITPNISQVFKADQKERVDSPFFLVESLRYGCTGLHRKWSSKRLMKSPDYTTDWGELPVAKA
ncbi:MAG: DUF4113 domain-containing protein [Candidatus Electrothrix sp. YB6]